MDTRAISGIYGYLTAWHYAAHLNAARIAHLAGQKHDRTACHLPH
jgi:hypothetical protein